MSFSSAFTLLFTLTFISCEPVFAEDCDVALTGRYSDHFIDQIFQQPFVQREEFRVYEIVPQVFYFQFTKQRFMTRTLLRFQEHFESPKFRGQFFGRAEFREWYRTTRDHGRFSYYSDWEGFNFPSSITRPFFDGRFKNLTLREKSVLDILGRLGNREYYVVGASQDDEPEKVSKDERESIRHEVAHALFHLDPQYRRQALKHLALLSPENRARIEGYLIKRGYTNEVLADEVHAYLLTDLAKLVKCKYPQFSCPEAELAKVARLIEKNFEAGMKRWNEKRQNAA